MTDFISISCDRFDELLPDLLEGTLSPRDRQAAELHQADCDRCAALVQDLDDIRSSAAALPSLSPSRDLWSGIAGRIEAPVVPLVPRTEPAVAQRRRLPWRSVAAAAALVAVTAGITHQVTLRSVRSVAASPAAAPSRTEPAAADAQPGELARSTQPTYEDAPPPVKPPLPKDPPQRTIAARPSAPASASPRATNAVPVSGPAAKGAAVYDREVELLHEVLQQRRGTLDPATVAIVEQNLLLIDRAITESREALRRDPGSSLLSRQLDLAMEKKIQLLRRAAMLPART